MKKVILLVLPILFIFGACKKYPDGPLISLNTKKHRIVNSWIIQKVLENGIDKTSTYQYAYTNFNLVAKKDNTYTLAYIANNTYSYNESGTWKFDNDRSNFILVSSNSSTNSLMGNTWTIYRLKEKEFWAKAQNGNGVAIEIHLMPLTP